MSDRKKMTTGAFKQSWRRNNPRGLLENLVSAHPDWSEHAIYAEFRAELRKPENGLMIDTIAEYWFTNNYRSIVFPPAPPVRASADDRRKNERIAEAAATQARAIIVRTALLDFKLPSGKKLRNSTAGECAKAGGWLAAVAKKVPEGKRVGQVLSEDQVAKLFKAA